MSHDVGNVIVRPNAPVAGEVPVQGARCISRPQRVQDIEALVEGILDLLIELQQKRTRCHSKSVQKLTEQVLAESKKWQNTLKTWPTFIHMVSSVAINVLAARAAYTGAGQDVYNSFQAGSKIEETIFDNVFSLSYKSTQKASETHQDLFRSERSEEQEAERKNQQQFDDFSHKLTEFYARLTQLVREMR